MAVIYLKHPRHGTKVATLEEEAENDRLNGWEDFEIKKPKPEKPKNEELLKKLINKENK